MVVAYTQEHVYLHPWHRVTAAAWRKFTDPAARAAPLSHILDVQTLSRGVDPRAGRLHAVRAIAGRPPPLPVLLRPLAASAGVGDAVRLRAHPERPDEWTLFTQETGIRCAPLAAVSATVAEMVGGGARRASQNAAKGKEVVERICDGLALADRVPGPSPADGEEQ
ncbi:hypothetical protein ZWY2020_050916 [Hordeum vulgare]|nr:hypothetical protein ZWY2020_050916 [Hordeum vulgare]